MSIKDVSYTNRVVCRFCNSDLIELNQRCGDKSELYVLQCKGCKLVQLSDFSHIEQSYYGSEEYLNDLFSINNISSISTAVEREKAWNEKRLKLILESIAGAAKYRVLDYGAGHGGFLAEAHGVFADVIGFDLSPFYRSYYESKGWRSACSLDAVDIEIDVVVLFHVLEHLKEPWRVLSDILEKFETIKYVVLEVPNTNEALNSIFCATKYRSAHYSSDHLYYFSYETLRLIPDTTGLSVIKETGFQRYSLGNNISWLMNDDVVKKKIVKIFDDEVLNNYYEKLLVEKQICDSIVFICERKKSWQD
jgi:SAM-dependent methyltransferase